MTKVPYILAVAIVLILWGFVTLGSQEASSDGETVSPTVTDDGYKLVESVGMTFRWKVVDDELDIILTSPAKGWLAVGFDPTQVMKDADIYIGFVGEEGNVSVRDDFATWFTSHEPDESLGGNSDVTVTGGSESAEGSRIHFRIPLDSGDEYDRVLTPGGEHEVMLAYGENDDLGKRHRDRSKFTVEL